MKYKYIILILLLSVPLYSQMELNSGVTTQLNSSSNCRIGFSSWYGWACGVNGVVIKGSTGSGAWINVSGNGIPSNVTLYNICGLNSTIAFVAGSLNSNTWVWKTDNGGANWIQVFSQPNGFINAIWMKNFMQGIMVGNPVNGRWSVWKTSNGGINWDSTGLYLPQSGSELGWSNSLCMSLFPYSSVDTNMVWFGTNNSRIYYSSNYGLNWTAQSTAPEQNSLCIAFGNIYPGYGLFSGGSSHLLKTTNYGSNWTIDSVGGNGSIVGVTNCAFGFLLARENKIYLRYSSNWFVTFTAPSGNYTYFDNRGWGANWIDHYAVRSNGGITMFSQGEGIKKISNSIPESFSLSQNYPNPFNPKTIINFQLSMFSKVKLVIYDLLGREINTLVNEQLKPGTYEVEWSAVGGASEYPSGVYFYTLYTEKFTQTKKMVLLK